METLYYIISHLIIGVILAFKWTKYNNNNYYYQSDTIFGKWLLCILGGWIVFIIAIIKLVIINDWNEK